MKKLIWIILLLVVVGAGAAYLYANRGDKEPQVTTLKVTRGDLVDGVGATGTLQAVTTVTVGSQVSGIVSELDADFNSIVKKDQVIAKLDPALLQTALETAKANMVNSEANRDRQKVALADAQAKLKRAQELSQRQLITQQDLETADVNVKQADAQLKSTESQIVQAQAAVDKAKVDLDHTIITAPIDGIIIKRSVDRGQTVAASMQAPELFIIAADLTKMQVNANIDESDVGRMRPGENVTFRVDAYPTDTFHGTVKQVRLNPTTVQNVVTYSTVIDVPNPDLRLKPGMTANVNIEIARRSNILRVPNAALRFRPTKDIFDALKQPMPEELNRGFGRGGRGGQQNAGGPGGGGAPSGQPGAGAPNPEMPAAPGTKAADSSKSGKNPSTASGQAPAGKSGQNAQNVQGGQSGQNAQGGQGGGRGGNFANMTPEERQKAREARLAAMTPEERAAFEQRQAERQANGGGRGGFGGGQGNSGGGRGGDFQRGTAPGGQGSSRGEQQGQTASAAKPLAAKGADTIDALFGPLPTVESRGRAWLYVDKQLKLVNLRLGISDGTNTEVLSDTALVDGQDVVVNVITPEMMKNPASSNANNPLMPQRGRGGPGGPGGGRGGGR
jgi:HlyD family secretion protein